MQQKNHPGVTCNLSVVTGKEFQNQDVNSSATSRKTLICMILVTLLLLSVLSFPNREGTFLKIMCTLYWESSYPADMVWTSWLQIGNVKLLVEFTACSVKQAIILSPADAVSKFQLCTVLSDLLALLLITFLLASTLQGKANNAAFVLRRLCTSRTWCWDNTSLWVPFQW